MGIWVISRPRMCRFTSAYVSIEEIPTNGIFRSEIMRLCNSLKDPNCILSSLGDIHRPSEIYGSTCYPQAHCQRCYSVGLGPF